MNTPLKPILVTALASALALLVGCSKPSESTGAPAPSISVGTELDDSVVTTRVKAALLADASVKSLDIAVVTRKGEVQLSGFVDNQGQATRSIEIARAIPGVSQVINDMNVKK